MADSEGGRTDEDDHPASRRPTRAAAPAARIVDGVKIYGTGATAVRALDAISADFAVGAFTAIMGPSGSGKSTLLHCLAGLDRLTEGQVLIGDVDLGSLDDKAMTLLRRERIGFVFQAFNLVPTLTAQENVLLPLTLGGKKPDRAWLEELARSLGIADRLGHRPAELSGGQQQRVATARALVTRPDLIFADEPTGNLDSRSATELLTQIRRAVDEYHQTVVMVTHDPRAAAYADRVLFLADGRVVSELLDPTADRVLDAIRELGAEGLTAVPDRSRRLIMWRVTLKGVVAHRLRYALTALAVLLGVAFIAGTFVLTDTINSTFNGLYDQIYQGTAAVVRATQPFNPGTNFTSQRQRIDASLATTVAKVPGVKAVALDIEGYAQLVGRDGKPIGKASNGPPTLGVAWTDVAALNPLRMLPGGQPPRTSSQVVIDKHSADVGHFTVGDKVVVLTQQSPGYLHHHRHRHLGQRGQPARRDHHRVRPGHRGQGARPARQGQPDQRGGGPGGLAIRAREPSPGGHPQPRHRGGERPGHHRGGAADHPPGAELHHRVPAHLRVHRPVRRLVRHLQHVLDHRRPAAARAGPAARRRREPPSGDGLGPRRVPGHRGARLGRRRDRGHRARRRAQGGARGARLRPAGHGPGGKHADGDRRPDSPAR